jgi:hypothetical protein
LAPLLIATSPGGDVRFCRRLADLNVICDPLEDGCKIMFTENLGLSQKGIKKLVRPKSRLEVFMPIRDHQGRPDYSSKQIMDEVDRRPARKK